MHDPFAIAGVLVLAMIE